MIYLNTFLCGEEATIKKWSEISKIRKNAEKCVKITEPKSPYIYY